MKIHIWDRLLAIITGIALLFVGTLIFIERDFLSHWIFHENYPTANARLIVLAASGVFLLLGLYFLISFTFRGVRKKSNKIVQKTDYGELSISVKAIEGMVQKCANEYQELELISTGIDNTRDGMNVRMKVALSRGVNIPLAINTLQKHIKQYVTSCSGIDVGQVQVEIVSAELKVLQGERPVNETAATRTFAMDTETLVDMENIETGKDITEDGKSKTEKRLFHQTLFGEKSEEKSQPKKDDVIEKDIEKETEKDEMPDDKQKETAESVDGAPVEQNENKTATEEE
ncbi:MAG: alkaline shock response membrane anchor protein AmaP [Clostridiales bacterium]|nr:alkaline shock response membrane anchor protein AmaP [Clostridiales bacterium]